MTVGRVLAGPLAIVLVAIVAGCGLVPGVGNDTLHIGNQTTIPVTLIVNEREIAVVQPNTNADVVPADLGAMPWHVEARTAGGRDLVALDVGPGSVHDVWNLDGTGSYSAPAAGIGLSCGQVVLYVGRIMPNGGPPGPGASGDCEP
ncbi:MAG TPA: hypothetical protein VK194_02370 [Candidatus Deferrimicrobium sp.]|nr:hypothetical protein [Candidatus Deferrimicrobium sp.]